MGQDHAGVAFELFFFISKCVGSMVVAVEAKTFCTHDFVTMVHSGKKANTNA